MDNEQKMTVADRWLAGELMESVPVIEAIFTYHAAVGNQTHLYRRLRETAREMAYAIHFACEPGPDRTTAMRKLRECVMTANQSIATNNAQYR